MEGKIIKKRVKKILYWILLGVIFFLVSIIGVINIPQVQVYIAQRVTKEISKDIDGEISIEKFSVDLALRCHLKHVLVKDHKQDTLFFAKEIKTRISKVDRDKMLISIYNAEIDGLDFYLRKYDTDSSLNLNYFIRQFYHKDTIPKKKWGISIHNINLEHSNFIYANLHHKEKPSSYIGVDYNRIAVKELNTKISNFSIKNDTIAFWVKRMSAIEQSGFVVNNFHSRMEISSTGWKMENVGIETPESNIVANIKFSYTSYKAMSDWVNSVNMSAEIKPSIIEMSEIKYFAPVLADMTNQIHMTGKVDGTVSQMNIRDLMLFYKDNTRLYGDINLIGLPNIYETYIHLDVHDCELTQWELSGFKLPNNRTLVLSDDFAKLGTVNVNGNFTGFLEDFVSYATFNTEIGEVNTDLKLSQSDSLNSTVYEGDISVESFNLGKFISAEDKFGMMNFVASVNGKGVDANDVDVKMDGYCSSLEFMGNTIDSIDVDGRYTDSHFSGFVAVEDDDIQGDFTGLIDLNDNNKKVDFISHIKKAKLSNLNILNRADDSELSTVIEAQFMGLQPDSILGSVKVSNLQYRENDVLYFLDALSVTAEKNDDSIKRIILLSDYIDAEFNGNFSFKNVDDSYKKVVNYYLPSLYSSEHIVPQDIHFNLTLKNTDAITHLFFPSLKIAKNTTVKGFYNSYYNDLMFDGESDFLELNGMTFKGLFFNARRDKKKYLFTTQVHELVFFQKEEKEETDKKMKLGIDNISLNTVFENDTIAYVLKWDDISDEDRNKAYIDGVFNIIDGNTASNHLNTADLIINDSLWTIKENNNIYFADSLMIFNDVEFTHEKQKIAVNGNISYVPRDKFDVKLNNFDISNFDMFFSSLNFDVDGIINADFSFRNIKKNQIPQFFGDLNIGDLKFNKEILGDMNLTSQWDNDRESFVIASDITYRGNKGSRELLTLNGDYWPHTQQGSDSICLRSSVNGLTLKTLGPFFNDFMSELDGHASGDLVFAGSLSRPVLTGDLDIVRAGLRIDYLNTKYYFADKVSFKKDAIVFDDIMVYDSLGNTSVLNGKVKHSYFSDYYLDLHLYPKEFSGLSTDRSQNSLFYGSAFASGKVDITGPIDAISFNVKVKTNKGTKVVIPISTEQSAMESDFITFIAPDENNKSVVTYLSLKPEGYNMNLELEVTPDAEAELILPFAMGNIKAKGNGNIRLEITSAGDFNMYGDYFIEEGDFIFKLPTIQLRREFAIRRGGKISWSGDPYDADLDIDAVYSVKSSLKGLPAIEALNPDLAGERVKVNCVLALQNKLFNPDIKFTLELPDSDERVRELVYSSIDTTNVSEMNKQMLYLLVLSSFSSSGISSSVNTSLSGTSLDILSNQIGNWLSNISSDLDVGINYQPGDSYTTEELEVALSTQLFDDRVSVDGNFGVTNMEESSTASNIVGDVNVEVKITPDGRFRVKAFNKTNNINLLEVDAPYTQGVGVFYRKEFDSFKDLFKRKKKNNNPNKEIRAKKSR